MNFFLKYGDAITAEAGIVKDKDPEDPGFRRDDGVEAVYAYYPLG